MDEKKLAELERFAKAGTPGAWRADQPGCSHRWILAISRSVTLSAAGSGRLPLNPR